MRIKTLYSRTGYPREGGRQIRMQNGGGTPNKDKKKIEIKGENNQTKTKLTKADIILDSPWISEHQV